MNHAETSWQPRIINETVRIHTAPANKVQDNANQSNQPHISIARCHLSCFEQLHTIPQGFAKFYLIWQIYMGTWLVLLGFNAVYVDRLQSGVNASFPTVFNEIRRR